MSRSPHGGRDFVRKGETMTEKTIHWKKKTITYDGDALMSWKVQRLIAKGGEGSFDAIDVLLCGKADEVAEEIGGTVDAMAELVTAICALETKAKN